MSRFIHAVFGSLAAVAFISGLACSDDDEPEGAGAGQASNRSAVCRDIAATRASLEDAVTSAVTLNAAGVQDALQQTRANVDSLATSARESEGGSPSGVEDLVEDVQEFRRLLATPNLLPVLPDLRQQAETIRQDLDQMEENAGCSS
jgi:hypothetical protein